MLWDIIHVLLTPVFNLRLWNLTSVKSNTLQSLACAALSDIVCPFFHSSMEIDDCE